MNRLSQFLNPHSITLTRDTGLNAESTLNQNRRLILQWIKDTGAVTRNALVAKTGLKPATITLIINELLEKGLIHKTGLVEGEYGRRVMGFELEPGNFCSIVVRVSPSYLVVGAYDLSETNLEIKKIFIDTQADIRRTADTIIREIRLLRQALPGRVILGVGVGVEGPYVLHHGTYQFHPFKSADYFDLGKELSDCLELPVVVNKATNFAVYSIWKNENKNNRPGIYVSIAVSYTIECGMMANGQILNGYRGAAGLLGKMVIATDSTGASLTLNDLCATHSVLNRVLSRLDAYPASPLAGNRENLNIRDIINAYNQDDELAVEIFSEVAAHLGKAVGNLINLLNPDYILVGDEIPQTERFLSQVNAEAKRYVSGDVIVDLKTILVPRNAKIDPALLGANAFISDAYIQSRDFAEEGDGYPSVG